MKKVMLVAFATMFVLGLSACQRGGNNNQMGNGTDQSATQSQSTSGMGQKDMSGTSKKSDHGTDTSQPANSSSGQ